MGCGPAGSSSILGGRPLFKMNSWIIVIPKNKGLNHQRDLINKIISEEGIKDFKLLEVRGEDVGFFVSSIISMGKKAIGITGEDLFKEWQLEHPSNNLDILKRYKWSDKETLFGKPVLCLLGPKNKTLESLPKNLRVAIANKYKIISKHYLNLLENKGYIFEKIYLSGSVEESFLFGLSDLAIDIVYSGKSAKVAGLKVYDKIFECDLVVIGKRTDLKEFPKVSIRK